MCCPEHPELPQVLTHASVDPEVHLFGIAVWCADSVCLVEAVVASRSILYGLWDRSKVSLCQALLYRHDGMDHAVEEVRGL
jgi:hypothetical protein